MDLRPVLRSTPREMTRSGPEPGRETLEMALVSVWRQTLVDEAPQVLLGGRPIPVARTRSAGLRTVAFSFGDRQLEGIEQNPHTASRWAKLAQEGNRIMQFRCQGRYVANVCEGTVFRYPAWKAVELPD